MHLVEMCMEISTNICSVRCKFPIWWVVGGRDIQLRPYYRQPLVLSPMHATCLRCCWNSTLFSSTKLHVRYLWLRRGENRFIFLWRAVQLAMMTDTTKFVVQSLYPTERSAGHQILEVKTSSGKSVKPAKEWVLSGTHLWHSVVSRKFIEALQSMFLLWLATPISP